MLSDFAFSKKEKSRGVYGKRTTLYNNYKFDIKKDKKFYDEEVYIMIKMSMIGEIVLGNESD